MSAVDLTRFEAPRPAGEASIASAVHTLALPWHRLALGAILLLAALLNFSNLGAQGFANSYYAAAVRSMSMSWHNFFFAVFDPSGFVTIDKPPLGFWFQVASVKLFGFSGVSLLLPEGLAGLLSVPYSIGWWGNISAGSPVCLRPSLCPSHRSP